MKSTLPLWTGDNNSVIALIAFPLECHDVSHMDVLVSSIGSQVACAVVRYFSYALTAGTFSFSLSFSF